MSALYGVIGDPISHSLSPLIHNGWIRDHGLDAAYLPMHVPDGELQETIETLERRNAAGLNITLPHKLEALTLADEASDEAQKIGAANTLSRTKDGAWRADNTDASGILADLHDQGVSSVGGKLVFVIGAGGAARAVVYALVAERAKVFICNRTETKAKALAAEFGAEAGASLETGLSNLEQADIVINTASLGHQGETLNLPDGNGRLFHDISYGKAAKDMLALASDRHWKTADGLGMLVHQAAESFRIWTGIVPSTDKALTRARAAVEMTL